MGQRKAGSTLQPLILTVTIPTTVPVPEESISEVRLLIGRKGWTSQPVPIDVEIPSQDYELEGDGPVELTLTWYPTEALVPGTWEAEVWIIDTSERVLKTPSEGRAIIEVDPSLVPGAP